ncbi:MAG: hypothetical protein ACRBCI_07975 [Cellvibrionaceae bacterium]
MLVSDLLKLHLAGSPFEDNYHDKVVHLYAGPYLIPVPNSKVRQKALPYHDLHHLFTGYSNSRIGEGEVGAWELGSGCWNNPIALFLNLGGVSTGLLYSPKRICRAFIWGCHSQNLYDLALEDILSSEEKVLTDYVFHKQIKGRSSIVNHLRFATYGAIAALAIPPLLLFGWGVSIFNKS